MIVSEQNPRNTINTGGRDNAGTAGETGHLPGGNPLARMHDDLRPLLLAPRPECIPDELKRFDQWIVWEAVWEDDTHAPEGGRWCKIPLNPKDGSHAETGERGAWGRFEQATEAYQSNLSRYAGIGFVMDPDDPFTVMLVEGAIADDNTLLPEAERIVGLLKSYTERDPDGLGIRVFVRAHLPPGGRRRGPLEMHESDGFLPVTGRHWPGTPLKVVKRQAEMEALHADIFPPAPAMGREKEPRMSPFAHSPASVNDKDLLALAFHTANGPRIESLYTGKTNGINGDRNAADLALCSMLGFYTGDDPMRLDRLFRSSALYRPKWDVAHYSDGSTYGQATVAKALEGCIVFYTPARSAGNNVVAPSSQSNTRSPVPRPVPAPSAPAGDNNDVVGLAPEGDPAPDAETSTTSPSQPIDQHVAQSLAPFAVAEAQGRAQGLAINERVLTAQEASKLLRISVRMLRDTVKPWRRFGQTAAGDRWLLSDLLARDEAA